MRGFDRLHPALQHHIVNSFGWRELRPVQEMAIGPALDGENLVVIAPTAGGYITAAFGWHYVFLVLAVLGVVVLAASALWLPDSYQPDPDISLKPAPIIGNFLAVVREPQFYTYAFTGAIAFAGLFAYVSGSPLVFMTVFGVSEKVYGWIFAALSVGFIGASQLNTLLLKRFNGTQIIRVALLCYAALGIMFAATALLGWLSLGTAVVFFFLLLACVGITNPNASSLSLAPFAKNAGSASALMGALQMGFGALISVLISMFEKPSATPVAAGMAIAGLLALAVFYIGKRNIVQPVAVAEGEAILAH